MIRFDKIIQTVDAHTAGEPLRIVTSGLPLLPGKTILDKRRYMLENLDHLRTFLMLEPRGHSGMYGCIITPPTTDDADFGVIFMHNEGYSTMCGHGILAVSKAAVDLNLIEAEDGEQEIRIDSPAGRVTSRVLIREGRVEDVSFVNVPSFVYASDVTIDVDGVGRVDVDIAFGGAFYAYVEAGRLGVKVDPGQIDRLVSLGTDIKHKVMDRMSVVHPLEPELEGIYGTIIWEGPGGNEANLSARNVCIFADAQIDRSPTGTGTSGRLALLYAQGKIESGRRLINRSVIDTEFWGEVTAETRVGDYPAVLTRVGGKAHVMGFNSFVLEPEDPLPRGFRLTGG